MRNLGKLKLNQLGKTELLRQEMNSLKGGDPCNGIVVTPSCGCGCAYCNGGGSSTSSNGSANHSYGYH